MAYMQSTVSGEVIETDSPENWKDYIRLTDKEGKKNRRSQTIRKLRKLLPPGAVVQCVLRSVSKSGMSRRIDFFTVRKNELCFLSGYMSEVLSYKRSRDAQGLLVGECGMDMGFAAVYDLSRVLYPKGSKRVRGRNGEATEQSDGGYVLKHNWV